MSNELENRIERMARMFKALGDPTRLSIFECLRGGCCGEDGVEVENEEGAIRANSGPTAGEVCCYVTGTTGPITSTVSHHLKELRLAGLITMKRQGKHMICGINQSAVDEIKEYLNDGNTGSGGNPTSGCC